MKILVTGGSSMVGKHLQKIMPDALYLSSKDCDLENYNQTFNLIKHTHLQYTVVCSDFVLTFFFLLLNIHNNT